MSPLSFVYVIYVYYAYGGGDDDDDGDFSQCFGDDCANFHDHAGTIP